MMRQLQAAKEKYTKKNDDAMVQKIGEVYSAITADPPTLRPRSKVRLEISDLPEVNHDFMKHMSTLMRSAPLKDGE